jgi:lysophospholipase L1-like esterase
VQSTGYGDANNRGTVDVYSSIDCDAIGETPLPALKIGAVAVFTRYVALGDSFTEGVGDPNPSSPNGLRGWADHVAVALAQANPELRYANLAIRGRRMDEILDEQVHTAAMFEPDLVTIYAGMNNLLLLRNDVDAMMARYAEGLKKLQQTGATVLAFTAADLGTVPLFRRLRGRAAVYNELLRGITDDLDLELVDFWRFSEFRDSRLWDGDRIHLSPLGHERFAAKVLDTLAVSHGLTTRSAALLHSVPPVRDFRTNLRWTAAFAAPYVAKRMRLAKRGARAEPKLTTLTKVL